MERSGRAIDRLEAYYGIWASNLSTPEFREIQGRLATRFSDYESQVLQNERLFRRIKADHDRAHLEKGVAAFTAGGPELGVISARD